MRNCTKHYRTNINGLGWRQTMAHNLNHSSLWTTDDREYAEFILECYLDEQHEKRMVERRDLTIEIVRIPQSQEQPNA